MRIFANEERIREEIEKKVRTEIDIERVTTEKEAKKKIEEAEKKAQDIISDASNTAEEIKKETRKEIEREKQKWKEKAEECEKLKQTVLGLKRIVREKNLAHLRNLARNVHNARVKRELIKANRQLIWLDDLYQAIDRLEN